MPSPIISVHLADVGPVRALRTSVTGARALRSIAGLRHADVLTAAPLGPGLLPRPRLGRVGLVAVWEHQAALQDFERSHPFAARLTDSFAGHFTVPRAVGAFAGMTPLADAANSPHKPAAGPVGALTYGQLRPSRALAFLKASAQAEHEAITHPALLFSTGLANPARRIVCTFSLWRDLAGMRDYADATAHAHARAGDPSLPSWS